MWIIELTRQAIAIKSKRKHVRTEIHVATIPRDEIASHSKEAHHARASLPDACTGIRINRACVWIYDRAFNGRPCGQATPTCDIRYVIILYYAIYIHDCTILHCTKLEYFIYYTILYHIILYNIVLYRTVLHYTILYNIALYRAMR